MTPTKIAPRVLYRRTQLLVLGPLGCYEIGDRFELEDQEHIITSIDHDGAGLARPVEFMRAYCLDKDCTPQEAMKEFEKGRTSYGLDYATPVSLAGMKAQCERNRREFGCA